MLAYQRIQLANGKWNVLADGGLYFFFYGYNTIIAFSIQFVLCFHSVDTKMKIFYLRASVYVCV